MRMMRVVTDIETVDGQYCFCLRVAGRELVLFVFQTEKEAQIASDALCQIAERAVDILPAAEGDTNDKPASEAEAGDGDTSMQGSADAEVDKPDAGTGSPFLGR
jgi:hypothetical protein